MIVVFFNDTATTEIYTLSLHDALPIFWIVDTKKEHIAVGEARKLNIPVVAILDTNCDPDEVDYKIPGNDDAIRSAALLTRVIADAVADGLMARSAAQANAGREVGGQPAIGGDGPLAGWGPEPLPV